MGIIGKKHLNLLFKILIDQKFYQLGLKTDYFSVFS